MNEWIIIPALRSELQDLSELVSLFDWRTVAATGNDYENDSEIAYEGIAVKKSSLGSTLGDSDFQNLFRVSALQDTQNERPYIVVVFFFLIRKYHTLFL
jgi:hypothetical protein